MYTSGWPKIQNRCCQSTGSAPASALKKWVPKLRSKYSSKKATVIIGMAKSRRKLTTRFIQAKTGIRSKVMPGARRLRVVTMKLTAAVSDAMPVIDEAEEPEVDAVGRG